MHEYGSHRRRQNTEFMNCEGSGNLKAGLPLLELASILHGNNRCPTGCLASHLIQVPGLLSPCPHQCGCAGSSGERTCRVGSQDSQVRCEGQPDVAVSELWFLPASLADGLFPGGNGLMKAKKLLVHGAW